MSEDVLKIVLQALELFWKGMAAILIAMLIICFVTVAINTLTKERKARK